MEEKNQKKSKNKKNSRKYIVIIIAIILIIAIGAILINIKNKNSNNKNEQSNTQDETNTTSLIDMNNTENAEIKENIKENNSKKLLEDKQYEKLQITDIRLKAENGMSNFTATVKNNTGKDYAGGLIKIKFINKDGSSYAELGAYMPDIKNGGTNTIDASTTADIANAYDFTIEMQEVTE